MAIDSTPKDMQEKELMERFLDGLKLASSCAKEMRGYQPKHGWDIVEKQFNQMHYLGKKLLNARGQTRQKLLAGVDEVSYSIAKAQGK